MESIQIKNLSNISEVRQLISVFSLAFESKYEVEDSYLLEMLTNSTALILGAFAEEEVLGGLVAFQINPIHGKREFYIYDIVVHPNHQRRGIGKRLIKELKEEARKRGIETIFVEAENEDTHAVLFYRTLGGEEVLVNHFNFKVS